MYLATLPSMLLCFSSSVSRSSFAVLRVGACCLLVPALTVVEEKFLVPAKNQQFQYFLNPRSFLAVRYSFVVFLFLGLCETYATPRKLWSNVLEKFASIFRFLSPNFDGLIILFVTSLNLQHSISIPQFITSLSL